MSLRISKRLCARGAKTIRATLRVSDSSLTPADIPSWLVTLFFFLNVGAVSLTAFLLLQYFVRGLAAERERSERLLLNVLPAPIAERLKRESGIIADRCPEVSVLFADLAGFTPTAERLPPEDLLRLRASLVTAGLRLHEGEEADRWLGELRRLYEPYVDALAKRLLFTLPSWLPSTNPDDWQTTAWDWEPAVLPPAKDHEPRRHVRP